MTIDLELLKSWLTIIVGIIGGVEFLSIRLKKIMTNSLKEETEKIYEKIDNVEIKMKDRIDCLENKVDDNTKITKENSQELRRVEISRLAFIVESGGTLSEKEMNDFWKYYDEYINNGGNTYVKRLVDRLIKEGKL